jgi:diaminopimelate epimerase
MKSDSSRLLISKIVGTGNDFLFIDARAGLERPFAAISRAELSRKLCDRHFGVGADGVVFVESSQPVPRLKWDFYNSDGSEAEMCGNASRCMGRWAKRQLNLPNVEFDTVAGLVRASADDGDDQMVSSVLDYVQITFQPISYEPVGGGEKRKAHLVNTGVPHAVVEISDIAKAKVAMDDIRALRHHPQAGPNGANVTFLQILSANRFATVTFERGIEDFTLSCGTGVLAAGAVGLFQSGQAEAELTTPGGTLHVSYGKNWKGAVLRAPAQFLFETSVSEEFFK